MKCNKCNYDFGTSNPNYCPNCGKKINGEEIKTKYRNIDIFRMCLVDNNKFEEFCGKKLESNIKDIRSWLLKGSVENYFAYCIVAEFDWNRFDYYGKYLGIEHGVIKRASINQIQEMFLNTKCYSNIKLRSLETKVSYQFGINTYRVNWWWYKEECDSAINEIINKYGKE